MGHPVFIYYLSCIYHSLIFCHTPGSEVSERRLSPALYKTRSRLGKVRREIGRKTCVHGRRIIGLLLLFEGRRLIRCERPETSAGQKVERGGTEDRRTTIIR